MRRLDHGCNIVLRFLRHAALEIADVDDHIDLFRAVLHGFSGLEGFCRRGHCAEREADDAAGFDARTRERFMHGLCPAAVYADGRRMVGLRLFAGREDRFLCCVGFEQGMVNVARQFAVVHSVPPGSRTESCRADDLI